MFKNEVKKRPLFFHCTFPTCLFLSSFTIMLDLFTILNKGGLVLWKHAYTSLTGSPVEGLIKNILIEERSGTDMYIKDAYALKWTFANELDLVFVVSNDVEGNVMAHILGLFFFSCRLPIKRSSSCPTLMSSWKPSNACLLKLTRIRWWLIKGFMATIPTLMRCLAKFLSLWNKSTRL